MKIKMAAEYLAREIGPALGLAPAKSMNDALRMLLFEAKDGKLTVTGSNMTITARHVLSEVVVIEEGTILVEAADLKKTLKALTGDEVLLSTGKNWRYVLSTVGAEFSCDGEDPVNYPAFRRWDAAMDSIAVPAGPFSEMVKRTQFASAGADKVLKFAMNGVRLEIHQDRLRLTAGDNKRLSVCERPSIFPRTVKVTVPSEGMVVLDKVADEKDDVLIQVDETSIHMRTASSELMVRLVDGNYPPYEVVLERLKKAPHKVRFVTDELMKTLRRATALVTDKTTAVRFTFSSGMLTLSAYDKGGRHAQVQHPIEYTGPEMVFGFNPFHFIQGVEQLDAKDFALEFTDPTTMASFREEADGVSFVYILTPLSVSK